MTSITPAPSLPQKLSLFASDIKISHTLFALPFALLSTFLASRGLPPYSILLLIVLCMITARTVAMAANRLLDAHIDKQNPRTARRALPSGALTPTFYWTILITCSLSFCLLTSAFWLLYNNPLPLIFSLPVLAFISAYPFLKRFTRLCHYYLGAALALAPICAWLAVTQTLSLTPFTIATAVLTWTAGFDILYATQDYHADLQQGLHSIPSKLGIPRALWVSRLTHVISALLLLSLPYTHTLLGPLYLTGAILACLLLILEHTLIRPNDLSKLNLSFFTLNALLSSLLATLGILDVFL